MDLKSRCHSSVVFVLGNTFLRDAQHEELGKLAEFRLWLRRPETFAFIAVEELVDALAATPMPEFSERDAWLAALQERYAIA